MAIDMNEMTVIGRLVRDAELLRTPSDKSYCRFSVAVNYGSGDYKGVSFFGCVIWGQMGENLAKFLTQGKQVCINGELRQESWEDRETGQAKKSYRIHVRKLQLLGGGTDKEGGQQYRAADSIPQQSYAQDTSSDIDRAAAASQSQGGGIGDDFDDDDIPF